MTTLDKKIKKTMKKSTSDSKINFGGKLITSLVIVLFFQTPAAHADKGKDFILSVVYGTLAGTLVGAATLAFTSNPGDNLNNVARGASYGLYAGIILGLYVTYAVDEGPEKPEKDTGGEEAPKQKNTHEPDLENVPPTDGQNFKFKTQPPKAKLNVAKLNLQLQPYLLVPSNYAQTHELGIGIHLFQYNF
jgi:hypothetical protein